MTLFTFTNGVAVRGGRGRILLSVPLALTDLNQSSVMFIVLFTLPTVAVF